jgi:hypothetical protein
MPANPELVDRQLLGGFQNRLAYVTHPRRGCRVPPPQSLATCAPSDRTSTPSGSGALPLEAEPCLPGRYETTRLRQRAVGGDRYGGGRHGAVRHALAPSRPLGRGRRKCSHGIEEERRLSQDLLEFRHIFKSVFRSYLQRMRSIDSPRQSPTPD